MDDFVNQVNRHWGSTQDPVFLAAFVLWRLNYIHPFINGNGRTARAACYFVLCLAAGGLLPGSPALPELITQNREEYIQGLLHAHRSFLSGVNVDLLPIHTFLARLVDEQLASAQPVRPAPLPKPPAPPSAPPETPPADTLPPPR